MAKKKSGKKAGGKKKLGPNCKKVKMCGGSMRIICRYKNGRIRSNRAA